MPIAELNEPVIGRWSPNTEIGKNVRRQFGMLLLLGITIFVLIVVAADFGIARPWMISVAALPGSLVYPQLKDWLIQRSVFRTAKQMNKGLCVYLRFISKGEIPREDTGVLWFEDRRLHFKGARCEFNFDVTRFLFYDHYVDSISTPYKLRAIDVGGKDLAIVFGGTVGDYLIGSYGDRIEEAMKQQPDLLSQEILPPIGDSLIGWCPVTWSFFGICMSLAALSAIATICIQAFHLTNYFCLGGVFGVLGYGILALIAFLDLRREQRAKLQS